MLTGQTMSGLASANNTTTHDKKGINNNNSARGSTSNRVSPNDPKNASITRNNGNNKKQNKVRILDFDKYAVYHSVHSCVATSYASMEKIKHHESKYFDFF